MLLSLLQLLAFISFTNAADPIVLDIDSFDGSYQFPVRTNITNIATRSVDKSKKVVANVDVYGDLKTVISWDYIVKEAFASTDFPNAVPRLTGPSIAATSSYKKDSIRTLGGEQVKTSDSVRFVGGGQVTAKNSTIAFVLDTAKDATLITEAKAIQSSIANGGADARTSALVAKVFASNSSTLQSIALTQSIVQLKGDLFSRAFLYLLSGQYETINADSTIKFTECQLAPTTTFNATVAAVKSITLTPSGDSKITTLTVQVGDTSLSTKNIDLISVISIDFPTGTFKFDGYSGELFTCTKIPKVSRSQALVYVILFIIGLLVFCVICSSCLGKGWVTKRVVKPKTTTEEEDAPKPSDMPLYGDGY